jgi:hypothetical protein
MFPFRTAREYPIFGSHADPVDTVFAPFRSATLYVGNCDMLKFPSAKKIIKKDQTKS